MNKCNMVEPKKATKEEFAKETRKKSRRITNAYDLNRVAELIHKRKN